MAQRRRRGKAGAVLPPQRLKILSTSMYASVAVGPGVPPDLHGAPPFQGYAAAAAMPPLEWQKVAAVSARAEARQAAEAHEAAMAAFAARAAEIERVRAEVAAGLEAAQLAACSQGRSSHCAIKAEGGGDLEGQSGPDNRAASAAAAAAAAAGAALASIGTEAAAAAAVDAAAAANADTWVGGRGSSGVCSTLPTWPGQEVDGGGGGSVGRGAGAAGGVPSAPTRDQDHPYAVGDVVRALQRRVCL